MKSWEGGPVWTKLVLISVSRKQTMHGTGGAWPWLSWAGEDCCSLPGSQMVSWTCWLWVHEIIYIIRHQMCGNRLGFADVWVLGDDWTTEFYSKTFAHGDIEVLLSKALAWVCLFLYLINISFQNGINFLGFSSFFFPPMFLWTLV